jgi:hypothetical protein
MVVIAQQLEAGLQDAGSPLSLCGSKGLGERRPARAELRSPGHWKQILVYGWAVLSPQELSDRVEIAGLLARYCDTVDRRDYDSLDAIFSHDAWIDFTATGGKAGDLVATKSFLADALGAFFSFQHLLGQPVIDLEGDRGWARTPCHNPMVLGGEVLLVGLWYLDELVRTADGWRISRRSQQLAYSRRLKGSAS